MARSTPPRLEDSPLTARVTWSRTLRVVGRFLEMQIVDVEQRATGCAENVPGFGLSLSKSRSILVERTVDI